MLGLNLNHISKRGYRQQTIACSDVDPDLCPHMTSLGLNELKRLTKIPLCNLIAFSIKKAEVLSLSFIAPYAILCYMGFPANTKCNEHLIIVTKQGFDVKKYFVFAGLWYTECL